MVCQWSLIRVVCHQDGLSVVSHQGGLSSVWLTCRWSLIRVVCQWSLIRVVDLLVVSHQGFHSTDFFDRLSGFFSRYSGLLLPFSGVDYFPAFFFQVKVGSSVLSKFLLINER